MAAATTNFLGCHQLCPRRRRNNTAAALPVWSAFNLELYSCCHSTGCGLADLLHTALRSAALHLLAYMDRLTNTSLEHNLTLSASISMHILCSYSLEKAKHLERTVVELLSKRQLC